MSKEKGKTISDWIECAKNTLASLEKLESDKDSDMARLSASELPHFEELRLPYSDFLKENNRLMQFLNRHERVTIRALPTPEGRKKGFTRKYEKNWPSAFEECMQFLKPVIKENGEYFTVGLTAYEPNDYGFILISGEKYIRGEIGKSLEDLSHGDETPIVSFVLDRGKTGHLEDKIIWLKREDDSAAKVLLRTLNCIKAPFDNFNPIFLEGYFEGVVTKTGIKFLDYKINPAYLS